MADLLIFDGYCTDGSAPVGDCPALAAEIEDSCAYWESPASLTGAQEALEGIVAGLAVILTCFYCFQHVAKGYRQWLVTYYTLVVAVQYVIALSARGSSPAALYVPCAAPVQWLRYAAWILISPALLITLSRATGLSPDYPRYLDPALLLNLAMLVLGVATAASSSTTQKAVLFSAAGVAGAGSVLCTVIMHIELYYTITVKDCRQMLYGMAGCFYFVWVVYPVLFIAGPEGFGNLSAPASAISYSVADIAKLAWGVCVWRLHSLCSAYAKESGTSSREVELPLGLGPCSVQWIGSHEMETVKSADSDSDEDLEIAEPLAAKPMQPPSTEQPPPPLPQGEGGQGEASTSEAHPLDDSGPTGRGRLSVDVKDRIKEIRRKSDSSQGSEDRTSMEMGHFPEPSYSMIQGKKNHTRLSTDMRERLAQLSERQESENSAKSFPARGSASSGGRLSLDMKERVAAIVARSRPTSSEEVRQGASGGRLSTDMSARVANISKRTSNASDTSGVPSLEAGAEGFTSSQLPWDSVSASTPDPTPRGTRQRATPNIPPKAAFGISGSGRLARRRSTEPGPLEALAATALFAGTTESVEAAGAITTLVPTPEQQTIPTSHTTPGDMDCGPPPVPSGPVKLLLGAPIPQILGAVQQQLNSHSAEVPIMVQTITSLRALSAVAASQNQPVEYHVALLHSSLVGTAACNSLRSLNVPILAFGIKADCGEKGEDYDGWVEATEGYMSNSSMQPLQQMELWRLLAFWKHWKEVRGHKAGDKSGRGGSKRARHA